MKVLVVFLGVGFGLPVRTLSCPAVASLKLTTTNSFVHVFPAANTTFSSIFECYATSSPLHHFALPIRSAFKLMSPSAQRMSSRNSVYDISLSITLLCLARASLG